MAIVPWQHVLRFKINWFIRIFVKMNNKFHYNSWIVGKPTLKTTFGTMIPTEPNGTDSDSGVQVVRSNSDIP